MDTKTEQPSEWVNVDALVPWESNPRINDGAVADVAASIKRFGFGAPIIARRQDNMVIAGHTRAIEMEPKYCDIIKARWEYHASQ